MQKQQCYDEQLFRGFLDERLNDQEESLLIAHLGDCSTCQKRLAEISGGKNVMPDLAENLAGHRLNESAWQASLPVEKANNASLSDIKSILGPTDDPKMLGRLGSYEICGMVGRGSTGVVFKALDPRLNRFVAIKMLAPGYSVNGSSRLRFEREGRAIAAVRDDHVIPIHGVDEFQGKPFIVMQYMPAGSLQQRLDNQGPLSTRETVRVGMQIAKGLAAAHRQGIIHRDVKPANVLLEGGVERAVVTDFGLARVADEATMTRSGSISGTPQFMSPEQARGETLDPRSDLFSLGSVLYAGCTGHSPFRSETLFGVIKRVSEDQPRPIRETNPEIEPWLAAFIEKLQAKKPSDRFDSANQVAELFADELAHLQSPTTVPEPARNWWVWDRPKSHAGLAPSRQIAVSLLVATLVGIVGWIGFSQLGKPGKVVPQHQQPAQAQSPQAEPSLAKTVEAFTQGLTRKERLAALYRTADRQFRNDQFADAEESFGKILELDPKDEQAALHYGVALHMQGKLAKAIPWHQRASKSKDQAGYGFYNLACVAALDGRTDDAFGLLRSAIGNGFTDARHMLEDPDLKLLREKPQDARFAVLLRLARKLRYDQWESDSSNVIRLENGTLFTWPATDKLTDEERRDEDECKRIIDAILASDMGELEKLLKSTDPNCTCKDFSAERKTLALPRQSPLVAAAKLGDMESGRILIDANANVEFSAASEVTPLMTAAEYGHLDFVKLLLDNKAKINARFDGRGTALTRAAGQGHLEVVKFLISKGAIVDANINGLGTALLLAAKNGHEPIVQYLLDQDATVNNSTSGVGSALSAASCNGHLATAKLLVDNGARIELPIDGVGTALIVASQFDQPILVEFLVDQGAKINTSVAGIGTPLSVAARNGNLAMVQKLLALGANIDVETAGTGTALCAAAAAGEFEIMEFFLLEGADIDAAVHGVGTALIVAIKKGNLGAAKYLIAKGAGLDVKTDGVGTALIMASREDYVDFAKYLLDHGAEINIANDGVGTALSVAAKLGNVAIVRLLIKEGADVNKHADGVAPPLAGAASIRHLEIVSFLLEHGADLHDAGHGSKDAYRHAKEMNDMPMLNLMRDYEKAK